MAKITEREKGIVMQQKRILRVFCVLITMGLTVLLCSPAFSASGVPEGQDVSLENVAPDQVDEVLAKLSDEQVRSLLISELQKEAESQQALENKRNGIFGVFVRWLRMMSTEAGDVDRRIERLMGKTGQLPGDLLGVANKVGGNRGMAGFLQVVAIVAGVLLLAFIIELLFRRSTRKTWGELLDKDIPQQKGLLRFLAADLKLLPELVNIIVYTFTAFIILLLVPAFSHPEIRMLFLALLVPIVVVRVFSVLSHLVCSPNVASLRMLPMSDVTAVFMHRLILFFVAYVVCVIMFMAFSSQMGMPRETNVLVMILAGSLLLFLLGVVVMSVRKKVRDIILAGISTESDSAWISRRFASLWHFLALLYLFIVWLIWISQILSKTAKSGSLLLSLLVVPMFFILDSLGKWVVKTVIDTLHIYDVDEELERQDALADDEQKESREKVEERVMAKRQTVMLRANRFMRLVVTVAVLTWLIDLWGYSIPYASGLVRAIFESLVTITLGLIGWKFISNYIENKIRESMPEEEEEEEEPEGEWGAAVQRGRSYTLLPMVRKFIGTVLMVMVTLIILSAIGVNIGPLLAGAGVIGLAIGFGAQKLVSDIFSGFFYLLDDAFRVGEYLQAGSVSGAVEAITLRNVMLRHHRGMLQIVPYSELGSITNFMRGGIVVKFNLEFPYDTDIDQVRKIIKKVGIAMLDDEELGKDFIRPVKSQGVREITSSVMVIRVKFTAKPGTHFVIRREAYRRITEALAAKGIHYAHRKVIVELPEGKDEADKQRIAEAGAAAGMAALAEEEEKNAKGGGGSQGP